MVVGHFRAADAEINPAHDIAQDALRVVVELGLAICGIRAQFGRRERSPGSGCPPAGPGTRLITRPARSRRPLRDNAVHVMWPRSVKVPRRYSHRPSMRALVLEHLRHAVRHRPHALADLRASRQAARNAHIDIVTLVGVQPDGLLQVSPCAARPGFHEVWISSPVRSRKPVLMNTTRSRTARMHSARLTVVLRSSSIIPIFRVLPGQAPGAPPLRRTVARKRHLIGPVHLGFDDVDRARARVACGAGPARSCSPISEVTAASMNVSGIGPPSSRTASEIMW